MSILLLLLSMSVGDQSKNAFCLLREFYANSDQENGNICQYLLQDYWSNIFLFSSADSIVFMMHFWFNFHLQWFVTVDFTHVWYKCWVAVISMACIFFYPTDRFKIILKQRSDLFDLISHALHLFEFTILQNISVEFAYRGWNLVWFFHNATFFNIFAHSILFAPSRGTNIFFGKNVFNWLAAVTRNGYWNIPLPPKDMDNGIQATILIDVFDT